MYPWYTKHQAYERLEIFHSFKIKMLLCTKHREPNRHMRVYCAHINAWVNLPIGIDGGRHNRTSHFTRKFKNSTNRSPLFRKKMHHKYIQYPHWNSIHQLSERLSPIDIVVSHSRDPWNPSYFTAVGHRGDKVFFQTEC